MSKLIDRSAETLGEKTKFLGKSSEKENPNTNEGELLRHPKDRNELRKEVFAALFSAAEKSDGFPEITVKTEWRSNALGKVVSEPPEELVPEHKANVVHWQQDDQTYNDEEDRFQALCRAVMEYRGTMKEYCKAVFPCQAIDAFAQKGHVQAGKLLEQVRFPSTAIH
ncbi:hypothetical protein KPL70_020803 [Citrus sinensis]|nr:hypothetical protein KPL70_020803 [Citrus sinensis]